MEHLPSILAIDDDKITQRFIARALARTYYLHSAHSGEEGIKRAHELCPDIILLDVEMPGLNGYEVCDALRQSPDTKDIPIIFLSGHSSLRERMLGFEAGADDYLVKPFAPEELLAKIAVLIRYRHQQKNLQLQVSKAEETAYTALTGSSELGMAMNFVEQSYNAPNYEVLAFRLFSITSSLGLNCSMLVLDGEEKNYFSSSQNINPLETEVMAMLRKDQRFIDFGCRTQINYDQVSLLVKNMPLDNMDRYGRIKDLLPAMLGAADAKIKSLNTQKNVAAQTDKLRASFQDINATLKGLSASLYENQQNGAALMRNMLNQLEFTLPGMGLEDDQESFIINLIDSSIMDTLNVTDATEQIGRSFDHVSTRLEELVTKQHELMDSLVSHAKEEITQDPDQPDPGSMEIELF